MFVICLKLTADRERISGVLEAHKTWLAQGFEDGVFLLAGALDDGPGGLILAAGEDRTVLEARLATDPFVRDGLVAVDITAFTPSQADPRLSFLKVAA
ncbi:YciI family protein [Tritonibacter mobilis]|uniref:YciI family protein n=1 Tax=Tritonibacter mobilis TaxID=379347 RepID=UPI003A5BAA2A